MAIKLNKNMQRLMLDLKTCIKSYGEKHYTKSLRGEFEECSSSVPLLSSPSTPHFHTPRIHRVTRTASLTNCELLSLEQKSLLWIVQNASYESVRERLTAKTLMDSGGNTLLLAIKVNTFLIDLFVSK